MTGQVWTIVSEGPQPDWPPPYIGVGMGHVLIPWQEGLCWGDAIQGARIVPYVAPYWTETTLVVRRELVRLFSKLGLRVRAFGPDLPASSTRALQPENIRLPHFEHMELPPLWADESVSLGGVGTRLQVGVCWRGSGGGRSAVGIDDDPRCIPAAMLAPLLHLPGVQFTALHFRRAGERASVSSQRSGHRELD